MSASPADTPVTMPALTVATAALDDCHVASDVTGLLEVSESAAVAVNCAVPPTVGDVPLTVTAVTFPDDGVDGEVGCVPDDDDVNGVDDVDEVGDGVVGELVHAAHTAPTTTRSRLDN